MYTVADKNKIAMDEIVYDSEKSHACMRDVQKPNKLRK